MLHEDDVTALRELPQPEAARMLLQGERGPLKAVEPFGPAEAGAGYLVYLAYRAARGGGILKGRPAYEALETLRGRVRSAAGRSSDLADFGRELFAGLGLDIAAMRTEESLWWRRTLSAFPEEATWWDLSTDRGLTEILTAATLLNEMLYQLKEAK